MQQELDFASPSSPDGLAAWRQSRQQASRDLAKALGFPLSHHCELWLKGGVRLCGLLLLQEEHLTFAGQDTAHLRLQISGVAFSISEIESCVRLD